MKRFCLILICLCFVLTMASCGNGDASDNVIHQSFDDADKEWKPSLLFDSGLSHIEEPEGTKVFTVDDKGNVTFTVTPADPTVLNNLASNIYGKIIHMTDDYSPKSYTDAKDSETHFKITYELESKKITVEITLVENVLTANIVYS